MDKILVTGGAGFIGSNIVKSLVEQGYRVTVLDDFSSGYLCNLEAYPAVEIVNGDIRDDDAVSRAIKEAVAVIHLAASVGNKRSIDNPILDSEINVIGTLRILEACRKACVPKVVYSSSAGVFGELKQLPIAEDHPIAPNTPYGASKLAGEKLCLAYAHLYNIEAICLRYFNVYGPNQRFDEYGNVIPIFTFKMLRGESPTVFGDGEQTRDFVNVRDVAEANLKAVKAVGVSGAFNIASGTSVSINRLLNLLKEISGFNLPVNYGPPRSGDVKDSLADISAVNKALGYEPSMTIENGLTEYIAWAKKEVSSE
jgi:UDP-glucose 4-epimerase